MHMKLHVGLLLFCVFLSGAAFGQGAHLIAESLEVFDDALTEMRAGERNNRLRFQIDGHVYTIPKYPGGQDISSTINNPTVAVTAGFLSLGESERERFLELRKKWLRVAIRALHASRGVATLGIVTKDRVMGVFRPETETSTKETPQRRKEFIQMVLAYMDHHLWFQAPTFINSNEFALEISLGIFAQAGKRGTVGYGRVLEYGFSLGFNRAQQVFAFEVFSKNQRLSSAMYPFAVAGGRLKVGLAAFDLDRGEAVKKLKHSTTSHLPFSRGYTEWSPDYFAIGKKAAIQLPFVGKLFWYENSIERRTLVRVRVGAQPFAESVEAVILQVRRVIAHLRGKRCSQVFL
jgi:hypothetical protein